MPLTPESDLDVELDSCCAEGRQAAMSRRHLLQLTGAGIAGSGLLTATTASQTRVAFARGQRRRAHMFLKLRVTRIQLL